ncbi:MAG: hypothetical protein JWP66_1822 [Naasia sp.]|nr:hypothetical protein [Naasia sp.]
MEPSGSRVVVRLGGEVVADTTGALRLLETSHPAAFYLPRAAFAPDALRPAAGWSMCEHKGRAAYFDIVGGAVVAPRAGWTSPSPLPGYEALRDHVAFYPGAMDSCVVDDERALPPKGGFYGGWITSRIVGPVQGAPGTTDW